jgi:hypothetical protein
MPGRNGSERRQHEPDAEVQLEAAEPLFVAPPRHHRRAERRGDGDLPGEQEERRADHERDEPRGRTAEHRAAAREGDPRRDGRGDEPAGTGRDDQQRRALVDAHSASEHEDHERDRATRREQERVPQQHFASRRGRLGAHRREDAALQVAGGFEAIGRVRDHVVASVRRCESTPSAARSAT